MWKTPTVLIIIVLVLLTFGIVMLASTSGVKALSIYNDSYYFVKRQVLWLILALLAGSIAAKLDYRIWRHMAIPVFIGAFVLLVLVFIPGVGVKIGGSRRWLHMGPLSFQPSELAKFSLILILAWWISRKQRHVHELIRGAMIPMIPLGIIVGLIFLEPDFGTAILLAAIGMSILFVGGARIRHLLSLSIPVLIGFSVAIMHNTIRMKRILAFLEPDKYVRTYSFQLVNAINAFIAGGWKGVGLGESVQKHFYLPEAHTDFIFAIIGEELGVAGSIIVLLLFASLFLCGIRISFNASDLFARLLAFGITMMITVQAVMNIAVVTGCMPTKGLPLPFISFGGSCLVMSLVEIGVLFNIAQHSESILKDDELRMARHCSHDF